MALIEMTPKGLYCKEGGFHIDPSSKVEKAVVTHAHTDHARKGSTEYFCTTSLRNILRHRIGTKPSIVPVPYKKQILFNNVKVSFHPAGHMLGSAQIRVEHNNEVWVVSGDYKREEDPTCEPFESVKCDVFITEATFALPKYEWLPSKEIIQQIVTWHKKNKKKNIHSVLLCYSLGKAQRILGELVPYINEPIYIHPAIAPYIEYYEQEGIKLAKTQALNEKIEEGSLILSPPNSNYLALESYTTAFVSGWMHDSEKNDIGFTLSDHADWPALLKTIEETGARKVFVTHGFTHALIQHLQTQGIDAQPLEQIKKERPQKGQLTLNKFLS